MNWNWDDDPDWDDREPTADEILQWLEVQRKKAVLVAAVPELADCPRDDIGD